MHLSVRQNWIEASLKTAGRPFLQLGDACNCRSASSQTFKDPRRLRAALYSVQFVVRYFARAGLLMDRTYQELVGSTISADLYKTPTDGVRAGGLIGSTSMQ